MVLSDNPIETKDKDLLKRLPLATKVADLIRSFEGKESFVIGVEGSWGTGKTSFVNLVLEELSKTQDTAVLNFNPWNFSGQNELIEDFFTSLVATIKPLIGDGQRDIDKIKNYALKLARKGEISFSPELSFWGIKFKAGEIKKFSGGTTLQDERKEIDKLLKSIGKKIVVVLDDLDRLDKIETRLVMKLVKMTANFPNTIFLLSYDRKRVAERLQEDGWPGEEYLKKIIQVSFTLPEPDKQGLNNILFKDLDDSIQAIYGEVKFEGTDEKRWGEVNYAGFTELFKTIRDIKRFISSLRLNWSIMGKSEINVIDFIGIEAIRVFAPHFYSAVGANKSLFTGTGSFYSGLSSRDNSAAKQKRYEELLKLATEDVRPHIEKICEELFPQMDSHSGYGSDWEEEWRREKRICAEERFDFYFKLGIPEGAVSESEITNLTQTLSSKKNFSETLLKFAKDKRIRPTLSKLLDHVKELTTDQAKILISSLWDLDEEIIDEKSEVFDFNDTRTQILRLAYHSIKNVVPQEHRSAFLANLVRDSKNLYPAAHFVSILLEEAQKKSGGAEQPLLSIAELQDSKTFLLNRIKQEAQEGKLIEEKNFSFYLYRWKEWEGDDAQVKAYAENLIKTRQGLLSYLKGFVLKVLSSNGNYNKLEKKALGDFMNLGDIEKLVGQITDSEIEQLGAKEKEAIDLFKNPKKDW